MQLQRALAEAETSAAYFGLGGPPRVGQLFRSADDSVNPIPRAASALVELAMTCPGLYYFATSWLPGAVALEQLLQRLAPLNESHEITWNLALQTQLPRVKQGVQYRGHHVGR